MPHIELEETKQTQANIRKLSIAIIENIPIIVEGDAGAGKTATIQYLASKTNTPLVRINLNAFTTIPDLLGRVKIKEQTQI